MPKVSIITPCFNSERYIGRTIESVQAQTLSDWEHVVVNDGSTDRSAAVVKSYLGREPRLRLVEQENGGVSRARNQGYFATEPGEYLLFLDADDCLEPAMLETLVGYLDGRPDVGMVYCKPRCVDADDTPRECPGLFGPRRVPHGLKAAALPESIAETPFVSIFTLCGLLPSLAVMRQSVYAKTSGWDDMLGHIYEDTDLFLQLALHSPVHYLPEPLVRYRRHPAQSTASETSRDREAVQQAKLYAKWSAATGLPPQQQERLDAARAFRAGRIVPASGLHAGAACLRRGQWRKAARFCGGALRRYAFSFLQKLSTAPGFPCEPAA